MGPVSLADLRGFVFDLDGCVWNGDVLSPGAGPTLAALHAAGRALAFISNNSRATGSDLRARLHRLGVAVASVVLTPLEIIGQVIAERFGPSRVLVVGAPEMARVIAEAGHEIVEIGGHVRATVVAVGNDFDFTFARLTAAARAVARGAPLVTPNLDPRLPIEDGEILPGCGAIVEAVAVAGGRRPLVVGKPEPPLFHMALARLGLPPEAVAMVGDSVASDMCGARGVGMPAVLYAPEGAPDASAADVVVRSFDELRALAGVDRSPGPPRC